MTGASGPPFSYCLEHRFAAGRTVLERTTSYAAAIQLVNAWADRLRAEHADGAVVVLEEAFHTVVARHPLYPADRRFDGGHGPAPEMPDTPE